jgi:hypothetical protein
VVCLLFSKFKPTSEQKKNKRNSLLQEIGNRRGEKKLISNFATTCKRARKG